MGKMEPIQPHGRSAHDHGNASLRYALLACRRYTGAETREIPLLNGDEERILLPILKRTKTVSLVLDAIEHRDVPASETFKSALREERARILLVNAASLKQAVVVSRLLEAKGIESLIIKGPSRSASVFGGIDSRRSGDTDVLVRENQYEAAGTVLEENQYRRGVPKDQTWWHDFLGESPFLPCGGGATVDLHFRIQQPGAPSPNSLEDLFSEKIVSPLSNAISIPSKPFAMIISYIEMSKAIRSSEAWIINAIEITLAKKQMSPDEIAKFYAISEKLGLLRLVNHIDRTISIFTQSPQSDLFGVDGSPGNSVCEMFGASDRKRFAHRSRLQYVWAEGRGLRRLNNFRRGLMLWYKSEMLRRRLS